MEQFSPSCASFLPFLHLFIHLFPLLSKHTSIFVHFTVNAESAGNASRGTKRTDLDGLLVSSKSNITKYLGISLF